MSETRGELIGRIAQLEYEAGERAFNGNHAGADATRERLRELRNKLLCWQRGEPWTGGGD